MVQTKKVQLDVIRKLIQPPYAIFKNYLYDSVTFDVDNITDADFGFTKVYSDYKEAKKDGFSKLGKIDIQLMLVKGEDRIMKGVYTWSNKKHDALVFCVIITVLVILNSFRNMYNWIAEF